MNILLTNDDGPEAYGLRVLREAVREVYRDANIVTLTPDRGIGGQALSVSCVNHADVALEAREPAFFVCAVRPADLIYLALGHPERLLSTGTFDLVATGVNHGANVGMEVFHSGTVGMAMLAATYFGVGAIAFSQQLEDSTHPNLPLERLFSPARESIVQFLPPEGLTPGRCRSVNFPVSPPIGTALCEVAMHSRYRPHEYRSRKQPGHDVTELARGLITVSELRIRVS